MPTAPVLDRPRRIGALSRRLLAGLLVALPCLSAAVGGRAEGLPTEPMLRIETGHHTAPIRDLEVRADGAVVATVADDKTLRLWDAVTGALLETVRTPAGPEEEGILNAVEYWPGESHIITAGFTGARYFADDRGRRFNLLYFIRFASGLETIDRVPSGGIVNAIDSIRPDPSARTTRLATAHARNPAGVIVQDETLKRVFTDDLGAATVWVEFGPDGRLAAAATNGTIRLYGPRFQAVRTWQAPSGRPSQVRFSPDGDRLAVGYVDVPRVDILETATLRRIGTLSGDAPGTDERFLSAVAWRRGAAGAELWASGGIVNRDRRIVVRRWTDPARPEDFHDIPVSSDAVTRLETTPDQDVLFASADPAWGRIAGATADVLFRRDNAIGDFRRIDREVFRLSRDGAVVDFAFRSPQSARVLRFDARALSLTEAPARAPDFATATPPEGLSGWRDGRTPTLRGRALALSTPRDIGRSATALPGGGFGIGSDYALTLFTDDGHRTGETVVLSAAAGMVASADGSRLVVAHRDGTVRWYALEDGQAPREIAALFVHGDGQRWILWSPDGHFAHSAGGGQELAGYIQNRGRRQVARWIDFSQLYTRYYDIDLMRHRVGRVAGAGADPDQGAPRPSAGTEDPAAAAVADAIERAPQVRLVRYCAVDGTGADTACFPARHTRRGLSRQPDDGDRPDGDVPAAAVSTLPPGYDRVRLVYEMVPGSEPIVRHVVFLNGRTTGHQTRGLSRERSADGATDAATVTAVTAEQVVAVEPGLNTLSVRAYGASNVFGKSHTLTLRVPEPPEPERPRLFVIAVGVDVYQGDIQDLAYARRDAVSVAMRLDDLPADIYEDVIVVRREDEEATLAGLRSAFAEVGRDIRPIDTVAVYLAGHGVRRDGQYYFVTHDVPGLEQIAERALSQSLLVELLGSLRGANTLLMLDTCHSGAFPANAPGEIGNDTGYFVLAASATEEEALDGYNNRNGVFGHAVLTTLDDDPKTRDGIVTAIDLGLVVPDRVSAFAGEKGYSQSAQFRSGTIIKDFPLAQARP